MNSLPAWKVLTRIWVWLTILLGCALLIKFWYFEKVYLDPGRFHREQLRAIVEEIRHRKFDEQSEIWFRISDFNDPKTVTEAMGLPINIWAVRGSDGSLQVSIMTVDQGHLGSYGFAYSDKPVAPLVNELYGTAIHAAGPMRYPLRKIDDHWWAVEDNTR